MIFGQEKYFKFWTDTGLSTALLVHPLVLVTAMHTVKNASRGKVLNRNNEQVGQIVQTHYFDHLPYDLVFLEMSTVVQGVLSKLSPKLPRPRDQVYVRGYSINQLRATSAVVQNVSLKRIDYGLQREITSMCDLDGASGGAVMKRYSSDVSAVHAGSFFGEHSLPIFGEGIPSVVVLELLRSLIGNQLK